MDRIGERFRNREDLGSYEFVIVEYNNARDVWVEFQDEYKVRIHTTYQHCKDGNIKNPYHPSVYGVGYFGVGKYKGTINGKQTKTYKDWFNILIRGFDEELKIKHPTYKDVTVNPELYNFQNFAEWWHNNYYEVEGEQMCVDKDILIKGNKEYRFDRMIIVPNRINLLFTKCDASRGEYPVGVNYNKNNDKYVARCQILNGRKHLGYYNTPHEAFLAYKEFKEAYIKEVADEYKGRIPDKLYEAMYKWEVEEDD